MNNQKGINPGATKSLIEAGIHRGRGEAEGQKKAVKQLVKQSRALLGTIEGKAKL